MVARTLARILIDRSTFHAAAHEFGAALDDFRQALSYLGEASRPEPATSAPALVHTNSSRQTEEDQPFRYPR